MNEHDTIARDIGRKAADDVTATIRRNMMMMETREQMKIVALYCATSALATAAGAYHANIPHASVDDVADGLLALLRPMIAASVKRQKEAGL